MEEQVSDATGAGETEQFAGLLRDLKDRSGLSYGALAKRLHMSTSTLHRYCNGTAVPNDYAPVERLARVCRATPRELVELHRRWVLADAARALRGEQAAATRAGAVGPGDTTAATAAQAPQGADDADASAAAGAPYPTGAQYPADGPYPAGTGMPAEAGGTAAPRGTGEDGHPDEPVVVRVARGLAAPRRRRTAVVASASVAAVLVAAVVVAHPWDHGGNDMRDQQVAGSAASSGATDTKETSAAPSPSTPSSTPSTPATTSEPSTGGASPSSGKKGAAGGSTGGDESTAVPFTIHTRPYSYPDVTDPCGVDFLADSAPGLVGPPAVQQDDAPRWVGAYGAVTADEQRVALTLQGTGANTVVLEGMHITVISKDAPLAWNDYVMGDGCGGGVETKSFDIDLDDTNPTVATKDGQRDFPYKVSESDPQVFYVTAHTKAHDVRWELTMDWSSNGRHGTVLIDNSGTPFRTSADVDRPQYVYPLGGSDWIHPGE
jgi:transcriptional regulator with XRE-family HTH domain